VTRSGRFAKGLRFEFNASPWTERLEVFDQSGTKVGWVYGKPMEETPGCERFEAELERRYPDLVGAPRVVAARTYVERSLQGKGLGRRIYETFMAESFRTNGPFVFAPDLCNDGVTSSKAMRVWRSLAKDYPSSGFEDIDIGVIGVVEPPVLERSGGLKRSLMP